MIQPTLFDAPPAAPASIPQPERARLTGHCAQILARLQRGPATNRELAEISLKYTGRISDLRHCGYDVRVLSRDRARGVTVYGLQGGAA